MLRAIAGMFGVDPPLLGLKLPHADAAPHVGEKVAEKEEVQNESVHVHQFLDLHVVELGDRHNVQNRLVDVLLVLV